MKIFLFFVYDPRGEKLLTRLRLSFNHLNEHKLRHGFDDTINSLKLVSTFLCVVIYILPKDLNCSIILRKETQT